MELMIVLSLFAVIVLGSLFVVDSGRELSMKTMQITTVEDLSQQMLYRIESELANAEGYEPDAVLALSLPAGQTGSLQLDSALGFPPGGYIVIDRGTASVERVAYKDVDPDQVNLLVLKRGQQCTSDVNHIGQSSAIWSGLAEPLANQTSPSPADYDGISLEELGPVYYYGDGTGFSYRIPVDPSGGRNYVNGTGLNWGAETPNAGPTLDGWMALYFVPRTSYDEAASGQDLNGDGDKVDVFDVGQIRRCAWSVADPTDRMEIGMGPTNILQERCHWGSDLDGDGYSDPMFLWNKDTNELHIRLFLISTANKGLPVVRKVESVMFLRNEPEL